MPDSITGLYESFDMDQRIIMIGSHKIAKQFYSQFSSLDRSNNYLGFVFETLFKDCVGAQSGQLWLQMKVPLDKCFNSSSIRDQTQLIDQIVEKWFELNLGNSGLDFEISIPKLNLDELSATILSGLCLGNIEPKHISSIRQLIELHTEVIQLMGLNSDLRKGIITNANSSKVLELKRKWAEFIESITTSKSRSKSKLLEHILSDSSYVSNPSRLNQTFYELIIFNVDIVANAIGYILLDISANQTVQLKLIKSISNSKTDSFDDIRALSYLNSVVVESARLHPGVEQTFGETNTVPITLGSLTFEPRTVFSLDTKMINSDPDLWPNPAIFDPSRFDLGTTLESKVHRFGLGPRKCVGRIVSDYLIKRLVVKIYSKFTTTLIGFQNNASSTSVMLSGNETLSNFPQTRLINSIRFSTILKN